MVPNWGYSAPHRNFQEGDVVPNSLNLAPHKIFMEGVVVPNSFDLAPHKCLRGDYNPLLTPNPFRGVGLVFLNEWGRKGVGPIAVAFWPPNFKFLWFNFDRTARGEGGGSIRYIISFDFDLIARTSLTGKGYNFCFQNHICKTNFQENPNLSERKTKPSFIRL